MIGAAPSSRDYSSAALWASRILQAASSAAPAASSVLERLWLLLVHLVGEAAPFRHGVDVAIYGAGLAVGLAIALVEY
jgi:hypothetical protein